MHEKKIILVKVTRIYQTDISWKQNWYNGNGRYSPWR